MIIERAMAVRFGRLPFELFGRYRHLNWALTDQGMVSGVNFLTGVIVARHMGVEEFGRFALAWMVVGLLQSLQSGIIVQPMMSVGPQQRERDLAGYYSAVGGQQVLFAAACLLLVLAGTWLTGLVLPDWSLERLILPLALAVAFSQTQEFMRRRYFAHGRPSAAFANDALRYGGQIAALICLAQVTELDSAEVLWVFAATAGVAALAGAAGLERPDFRASALRLVARRNWRSGKWLTFSALLQMVRHQLIVAVSGGLLGVGAVGAMRAVDNLLGVTNILFYGLDNVVPTRAARHLRDGGPDALRAYLLRVAAALCPIVVVFTLVASAAPEFWIGLVYGDAFVPYAHLLPWFAAICLLRSVGLPIGAGLRALEHTRPGWHAGLAATTTAVLTLYPLATWLGTTGVPLAMLVADVLGLTIAFLGLRAAFATPGQRRADPEPDVPQPDTR